jgi:hypothetical protein
MAPVVSPLVNQRLVFLIGSLPKISCELGKETGKTVTDGTSYKWLETEQREGK